MLQQKIICRSEKPAPFSVPVWLFPCCFDAVCPAAGVGFSEQQFQQMPRFPPLTPESPQTSFAGTGDYFFFREFRQPGKPHFLALFGIRGGHHVKIAAAFRFAAGALGFTAVTAGFRCCDKEDKVFLVCACACFNQLKVMIIPVKVQRPWCWNGCGIVCKLQWRNRIHILFIIRPGISFAVLNHGESMENIIVPVPLAIING